MKRLWVWFVGAGPVASAAYLLLRRHDVPQSLLYALPSVAMTVAIALGIRVHRPRVRRPWNLLLVGSGIYAIANLIWYVYPFASGNALPFPSIADPLYIAAYLVVVAGFVALIRNRIGASDRTALIDTAIITMAVGALSWLVLMEPFVRLSGVSLLARFVSISYPAIDVMILAVLVRLMIVPGKRPAAQWLLALFLGGQLVADTFYAMTSLRGTFHYGHPLTVGWIFGFAFLGAAALHPSMRDLSERLPDRKPESSLGRLILLAGAAMLPLVILIFEHGDPVDVPFIAGVSAVMFLLVIARLHRLGVDLSLVKQSEEAVQEKYRTIVETTDDWIWECNAIGAITYSNAAVRDILGFEPEELTGVDALSLIREEDREGFLARWHHAAHAKQGWAGAVAGWRHRDGSYRELESNASALLGASGELLGFRGADRDVTDRRRLEERIAHQAMYDGLTELANRALFTDRLAQAMASAHRHRRPVVVMMMDLNGFKGINDTYGHAVGDLLLTDVGRRIQESVRPSDTVARLGGDEFAVLALDADIPQAAQIAERIVARLRAPFFLDGRELFADLSIGIAEAGPDCSEPEQLLRNSDAAMYAAKREGKGRFEIYEPQFHAALLERLSLGTSLRRAVERGEFILHYQPIVTLADQQITGLEALVRWAAEGKGLIPPTEFIPIAEQTGLIIDIDRWVLQEACQRAAAWQRRFTRKLALGISVNVSARHLHDPDLVRQVSNVLRATRLDPKTLTLEITEGVVMKDIQATIAVLSDLKTLGVSLAIDDFGIGFSSLSYLRQLPVDVVKIDRSFVSGVASGSQEWTLARGIVKLVHGLGLETIAEGVERADQVAHLRALGCRLAQGYYFARPMAEPGVEEFLENAESRPASVQRG